MTALAPGQGIVPPEPDADSGWWWEALAAGTLLLPHCTGCGGCFFPPMPGCPHCGSLSLDRIVASGRGRIYSWVVIYHALDPAFAGDIPAVIVAVDLDEGARVVGRAEPGTTLEADNPVVVVSHTAGDATLLGFRNAR